MRNMKLYLGMSLMMMAGMAYAAPTIILGTPENYCVVFCYIRVPFTITQYESTHESGRVFCDFDADVTSQLPIFNGEPRTKNMRASAIGIFTNTAGVFKGEAEMDTGIRKKYFVDAKLNSARCHP